MDAAYDARDLYETVEQQGAAAIIKPRRLPTVGPQTASYAMVVDNHGAPAGRSQVSVPYAYPMTANSYSPGVLSVTLPPVTARTIMDVVYGAANWVGNPSGSPAPGASVIQKLRFVQSPLSDCTSDDPCADDPYGCLWAVINAVHDVCGPQNLVSTIQGARASFANLYAKNTGFKSTWLSGNLYVDPTYDIYISWHLDPTAAGLQVPVKGYDNAYAQHYYDYSGTRHSTRIHDNSLDINCKPFGSIVGNRLLWDASAGDYGWTATQTCTWNVHASATASVAFELKVSLVDPGLTGSTSVSLTFGGSYGCSDQSIFQSELLIKTTHQMVEIPITSGWGGT